MDYNNSIFIKGLSFAFKPYLIAIRSPSYSLIIRNSTKSFCIPEAINLSINRYKFVVLRNPHIGQSVILKLI